ncbi:MAG: DUF3307 domain-containing protein [Cyclobacteriaceae bacterium]
MEESSIYRLFTEQEGLQLVNLLLAQFISDFVLQTDKMVQQKRWFSSSMGLHIIIVYVTTALLSGWWMWSAIIAISHWVIDAVKMQMERNNRFSSLALFVADQVLHVAVILLVWAQENDRSPRLLSVISIPLRDNHSGQNNLGYMLVVSPVGYLIRFATQNIVKRTKPTETQNENDEKVEHGGKLIGQFERVIILTFVLLNQYEAIGFLITGKSIIRFAQKEENLRSEYVLVGTMMSYAFSIIVGVLINWLLMLAG